MVVAKAGIAVASFVSVIMMATPSSSSAKRAPQAAPASTESETGSLAAGFHPCEDGPVLSNYEDYHVQCLQLAAAASRAVEARTLLISQNPGEAGCVGKDAATCLASLGRTLVVSTSRNDPVPLDLPTEPKLDIHGAPTRQVLLLHASLPGPRASEFSSLTLSMNDGVHVSAVDFDPRKSLLRTQTAEDWDQTGIYEFATGVAGTACIGADKLQFYRRVDALMKNGTSTSSDNGSYRNRVVGTTSIGSDKVCGQKMSVSQGSGYIGEIGSYASSTITFGDDLNSR
jgi:hypothetical protein